MPFAINTAVIVAVAQPASMYIFGMPLSQMFLKKSVGSETMPRMPAIAIAFPLAAKAWLKKKFPKKNSAPTMVIQKSSSLEILMVMSG